MFKKQKPIIEFISTVEGLADIEECVPKAAVKYTPKWWKDTPLKKAKHTILENTAGNVKNCPSFPDYFSNGYVIPMWCDTILSFDEETQVWNWKTSSNQFTWDVHTNEQFLDFVSYEEDGKKVKFLFKANCPWRIKTPRGWSVMQLPLLYHFDHDFSVMPGIIDTDVHTEINQQVAFKSDKKEILIKRGTPFVQYIPFKRQTLVAKIRDASLQDIAEIKAKALKLTTKFVGTKAYNSLRKEKQAKCPITGRIEA